MDLDGDGLIKEKEFVEGVGSRLKLTMPISLARAVFQRLDTAGSGQLSYDDFIGACEALMSATSSDLERMSNEELLRVLSLKQKTVVTAFEAIDLDKDAKLSCREASVHHSGYSIGSRRQ
jgi:Ca2+-binding EF-hand superfamily protein